MWLYFPAANGLHPVPEHCQEKPSNNNREREAWSCGFCGSCLRTGLDLASCLSAERIRYGLISPKTTSSVRLQSFFFPAAFCEVLFDLQIISLHFSCFQSLPDFQFGNNKERNWEFRAMTCQVKAGVKFNIKTLLSHAVSSWTGIYGMFALVILSHTALIYKLRDTATWLKLKSPDCIWYDTHQHTIFVKTCGLHAFFSPAFPRVFLFISTPPPSPSSPLCLPLPLDPGSKCDIQWQTETFF